MTAIARKKQTKRKKLKMWLKSQSNKSDARTSENVTFGYLARLFDAYN